MKISIRSASRPLVPFFPAATLPALLLAAAWPCAAAALESLAGMLGSPSIVDTVVVYRDEEGREHRIEGREARAGWRSALEEALAGALAQLAGRVRDHGMEEYLTVLRTGPHRWELRAVH